MVKYNLSRHRIGVSSWKENEPKFKFKTWLGKEDFVEGIVKEDIYITIFKKELKNFKVFLEYNGPIKAPIKKDQEIGNLIIETPADETIKFPITENAITNQIKSLKNSTFVFHSQTNIPEILMKATTK